MVLMPDRVRRYGPLVRRQRMHKQDRFLNKDFSRVHPSRGHGRGLHGQGYSLGLGMALVVGTPKGGVPTNQPDRHGW